MVGLPDRRPGLAEIAQPAADRRGGQPDRRVAGKFEIDCPENPADRQQGQNAVLLAAVKATVDHAVDLVEGHPAKGPLEWLARAIGGAALPAKPVGGEHEYSRF